MEPFLLNHTTLELVLFGVSGGTTLLTTLLTCFLVHAHLNYYTDGQAQTYIIRIIAMPVVYCLTCMFSIFFVKHIVFIEPLRDCYEAFVLYQFFALLLHYFNSEARIYYDEIQFSTCSSASSSSSEDGAESMDEDKASLQRDDGPANTTGTYLAKQGLVTLPFPLSCISPFVPGDYFLIQLRRCVFQYVVLRPLLAILAVPLEFMGLYHMGSYSPKYAYVYITTLLNISISVAFYALYVFYHLTHHIIKKHHPLAKLLAVKAVLFFTFWQSAAISALYYFGFVPVVASEWDSDESASIISNVLIGCEMVILSLSHIYIFSYRTYKDDMAIKLDTMTTIAKRIVNPVDLLKEGKEILVGKETRVS